jgi:hypothetical protein
MVDKEHVAAFDEGFVLRGNFGKHDARLGIVGEPACVEAILQ